MWGNFRVFMSSSSNSLRLISIHKDKRWKYQRSICNELKELFMKYPLAEFKNRKKDAFMNSVI